VVMDGADLPVSSRTSRATGHELYAARS
jgi:hypothetical protein